MPRYFELFIRIRSADDVSCVPPIASACVDDTSDAHDVALDALTPAMIAMFSGGAVEHWLSMWRPRHPTMIYAGWDIREVYPEPRAEPHGHLGRVGLLEDINAIERIAEAANCGEVVFEIDVDALRRVAAFARRALDRLGGAS